MANAQVLHINSEKAALEALRGLLSREIDAKKVQLDLSSLNWARARFAYKGEVFDQTVTASVMRGLVEFQNDFYRSAALILRNDARITRLNDAEKTQLALVFSVRKGSSDLSTNAVNQLEALAGKAIEKMNSRDILIAFLVTIILYFGMSGMSMYFDYALEEKKIEHQAAERDRLTQEKKDLYRFMEGVLQGNRMETKILKRALRASESAREIRTHHNHAIDEIIKNSNEADEIVIQNTKLDATTLQALTRSHRSKSEDIIIKRLFWVSAVESENTDQFVVHLDSVEGEGTIIATLEDPLVSSRYQKAISTAEWKHRPVMVHLSARKVGENIRDAKILKAYTPRNRTNKP